MQTMHAKGARLELDPASRKRGKKAIAAPAAAGQGTTGEGTRGDDEMLTEKASAPVRHAAIAVPTSHMGATIAETYQMGVDETSHKCD